MTCEWPKVEGYIPSSVVNFFREMTEPGDYSTPAALVEQAYTRWCRLNAERASILHRYVHCLQLVLESDEYRGFRLKDPDPGPDPEIRVQISESNQEILDFDREVKNGSVNLRQIRGQYSQQRIAAMINIDKSKESGRNGFCPMDRSSPGVSQAYVSFMETRKFEKIPSDIYGQLLVAYLKVKAGAVPPEKIPPQREYRKRVKESRVHYDANVGIAGGPDPVFREKRAYGTLKTVTRPTREEVDVLIQGVAEFLRRGFTRQQLADAAGVTKVVAIKFVRGEVYQMRGKTLRKLMDGLKKLLG